MAKKPDFAALKQRFKKYMFEKGERVGLVLCAAISVLLIGLGIWNGLTSSRPKTGGTWQDLLKQTHQGVDSKIVRAEIPPAKRDEPKVFLAGIELDPWRPVRGLFEGGGWIALIEGADTKRRNPVVLPMLFGDKQLQVDYVPSGYLSYELNLKRQEVTKILQSGGKAGAGAGATNTGKLVTIVKPRRMLVVTAIFPLKEQLEEYRKALRLASLQDLVAKPEDIPDPVGLNIYRCEIQPNGEPTPWQYLCRYNMETEALEVAERIDHVLREAHLDAETAQIYARYMRPGLAFPLLHLAHGSYPKLNLEGIEGNFPEDAPRPTDPKGDPGKLKLPGLGKEGPKGKQPGPEAGGPAAGNFVTEQRSWKDVPEKLMAKFAGDYQIFNPVVEATKGGDNKKGGGWGLMINPRGGRPMGVGDPKEPKKTVGKERETEILDALIRFFDVDVEPGKVYRYCVQVRMKNPNFEVKENIAFHALADIKELLSPFTVTPEIRIPMEYHFYAADQMPDSDITDGADRGADRYPPGSDKPDKAAVQVHRWVRDISYQGVDHLIGDWAIAERLLVRKGEFIGRSEVFVEVPKWSPAREAFEIGYAPRPGTKKMTDRKAIGLPVDFLGAPPVVLPSLLVDFHGGRVGKEESAMELLVLTPEGKLLVRNSRIDTDEEFPEGKERAKRHKSWRDRIRELRSGATSTPGVGPLMPGNPRQKGG